MPNNSMYVAIAAALAGLGLGGSHSGRPQSDGHFVKSQPSEVAHLSKKERLKRRRTYRMSRQKR